MPEFIPEHTPRNGIDDFTRGYLDCAEWLLDDGINRDKIRGWFRPAIKSAVDVCRDFQNANAEALAIYREISGRDDECAGHDFYLSRNGHGAGFFDRGNDPVFDQLQDAARGYGEASVDCYRGWLSFI